MNDERKKRIKDLVEAFESNLTYEDVLEAEAMAEGYVEGLKDGMNISKWIPCEERLPSEYGVYFTSSGKSVGFLHFGRCGWSGYGCGPDAWMPLPEPYMKGIDDEEMDVL